MQEALFSMPFDPPKRRGQLNLDDWIASRQNNVFFHRTQRPSYHKAPSIHGGATLGQTMGVTGGDASTYVRRMTKDPVASRIGDETANLADAVFRTDKGVPVSRSIADSLPYEDGARGDTWEKRGFGGRAEVIANDEYDKTPAGAATRNLHAGVPVAYRNDVEGDLGVDHAVHGIVDDNRSDTSFVIPKGAHTTWEQDVVSDPGASPLAQRFAQQRISENKHGQIDAAIPNLDPPLEQQGRLFGFPKGAQGGPPEPNPFAPIQLSSRNLGAQFRPPA